MGKVVLYEKREDYSVITLNRPDKRNAISKEVVNELTHILNDLHKRNDSIKFLIITGSGQDAFCSGGDLNDFHGDLNQQEAYLLLKPMQEVLFKIATLPFPTIAWMNGSARGGGMELASACDFRYASEKGTYGFVQGQLGISTGWGGGSLLYHRIQKQLAFEWLLMADVRNAQQLKDIHFIHNFIDANINDSQIIKTFKNRSVEQMHLWKWQYLKQMSIEQLKKDMENEVLQCSHLWESEAHKRAVQQFFNKKSK